MPLSRRNVGQVSDSEQKRRGSTIWEDEAEEFWKKMEPVKRCRRCSGYVGRLVIIGLLCGGAFIGARVALSQDRITAFKAIFMDPSIAVTINHFLEAEKAATSVSETVPQATSVPETFAPIKVNQEQLRGLCRVSGVQSSWHQETCKKLCMRDPYNAACMNGCSYGSLTMTKAVCDKMEATEAALASRCPDSVSCMEACRAYDDETPFPDLRNSCVRGCSNIVPSACARSLQIYRDLLQNALS